MISTELLAAAYGTEEDVLLKQAGALDIAGRVAAAVVLLQLIDSQKNHHAQAEYAKRQVSPTIQSLDASPPAPQMIPYPHRQVATHHDFRRGPQLFISAESPDEGNPDVERERYRMGFVRNVPAGMDGGMVRLASDEAAMADLAMAQQKIAAGWLTRASGAMRGAATKAWSGLSGAPAVPPMNIPPPITMAPNRNIKVPAAQRAAANRAAAQPAPAAPPPPPAAGPTVPQRSSAPKNVQNINPRSGSVLPGLSLLGVGAGVAALAPRVTGKVLDYAEKERGATPWGMSPYGAIRPNHVVNEYGQAMPG